jgi:SPX domain protein involved in polyphosphate accumulation
VDSFSKLLHGCAALLPDLAQAVPFWIDDVSVRESLLACSPSPERSVDG